MNYRPKRVELCSVVIPAYNEEDNIEPIIELIIKYLDGTSFEIIFINDGSKDQTLERIKVLAVKYTFIKYISFSRNFGHQSALKSGYDYAKGDCVITLDADLQHPVHLLPQMIEKWSEGNKIVSMVREKTEGANIFKSFSSRLYYTLISYLSSIEIRPGSADFKLLDREVVNYIRQNQEAQLFFRAYIPWLGFEYCEILYTAQERHKGVTKYSLKRMIKFAVDGITSFSIRPLRVAVLMGFFFSFLAFVYAVYALYVYFFSGKAISGWASVMLSVLLIGGIQLMFLGILGEYIGKIFIQIKGRPLYVIKETNIN